MESRARNLMDYFLYKFQFSWYDGLARCASMNMSLVSIDSKRKSDDITALLKKTFGRKMRLWIGGAVNGVNPRQFVWIETGKKFVFTNWAPGQPDFAGSNEYCAQTGWTDNMEWNDHVCGLPFGFMCEPKQSHNCNENTKVTHLPDIERVDLSPVLKQLEGRVVFRDFILNINR